MATVIVPGARPTISQAEFESLIQPLALDTDANPLLVAGIRGYYSSMGSTVGNDRGLYDDALILYAPSEKVYKTFNGNTDPSKVRIGSGTGTAKGMASLNPGVWPCYRFSVHGSKSHPHEALCQRAGEVVVTRDGTPSYQDRGSFGINIHRGGNYGTSSEGCQTIPPAQWDEFISSASDTAKALFEAQWRTRTITYVLLEATKQPVAAPAATAQPTSYSARTFLEQVIRPTLKTMGYWSEPAELLLLGTALAESDLRFRVQHGDGPARGLFQMEPKTHDDIWVNFLAYRKPLGQAIRAFQSTPPLAPARELELNDAYACAMARAHYLRVKAPLPTSGKPQDLGQYWKDHYNTAAGKGTVKHFIDAWEKHLG